jgi:hypothetical protein
MQNISRIRRNAPSLIFGLILFVCATFAHSQNVRYDGVVQTRSGAPAPGAFVAVCSQPANTSVTPCTPTVPLCSSLTDVVCSQPNPLQADGLGNYHFYVAISRLPVTMQFYGTTVTTSSLPDQTLGAAGSSGGGGGPTLQVNGTPLSLQTLLNLIDSTSVHMSTPGGGQVAASVFGNPQVQTIAMAIPNDTGSGNTYAACPSPAPANPVPAGQLVMFLSTHSNGGPSTFNLCSFGAANLTKNGATALSAGDIANGTVVLAAWDGTQWQDIDPTTLTNATTVAIQVNGALQSVQTTLNFVDNNTQGIVWIPGAFGQVQARVSGAVQVSALLLNLPADSGVVNNYASCPTPVANTIAAGNIAVFVAANTNSGASTFNYCGFATKNITKNGTTALAAGDIVAGGVIPLLYDGTEWQDLNPMTGGGGSAVTFKTNGNPNADQTGLDLESQGSIGNLGDFFCANTSGFIVICNVAGIIDLTSTADGAPGGGLIRADVGVDSGATNAYVACGGGAPTNPQAKGMEFQFIAANTNTGASTLQWCSQTVKNIVKAGGSPIIGGDIVANQLVSVEYTGTAWQLLNPASTASGTVAGQQKGQPTIGASASTLTTENATFIAQAFSGADVCAKITAALNSCATGAVNTCHIIVDATTPGSTDVCGTTTSNFWSGVPSSLLVDLELRTLIQVKRPVIFPAAAHLVHGVASSQNFRGSGFIMDPTFTDPGNNCNFVTGTNGPFTTGTYLCMIIDGGGNWSNNAFGGKWRDLSLDCNGVTNCIPYYTGNEQEDSGLWHVRVWGLAVNSATSQSACGFWDHSVASGSNSGPSHFTIKDSYCDPWGNGSTGTTTNNTIYGWTYEGNGSGGNITIDGGTVRANSGTQLMVDGVWIDGSNQPAISNIHCEWMSADCIALGAGGHGTIAARVMSISDANHSANGVHFYSGSLGGVATSIQAQGAEVQDDVNTCTTAGSTLEFYTVDDGGQGWWNGGFHVCSSGNTDKQGALAFSASTTSATYTFAGSYSGGQNCVLTPQTTPGTTQFWPTISAGVLTLHATASYTGTVNYQCTGLGH